MRNDYAPISVNPVRGGGGVRVRGGDLMRLSLGLLIVRRALETKPKVQKTGYKIVKVKIAASAIFHLSKVVDG